MEEVRARISTIPPCMEYVQIFKGGGSKMHNRCELVVECSGGLVKTTL